MTALRQFLRDVWTLAIPYWFSEDRWPARGLLAVLVAMNLGLVYLNVLFNRWNNAFYNTLRYTDRKSTRLNSSHGYISYAVFCLKKKKKMNKDIKHSDN